MTVAPHINGTKEYLICVRGSIEVTLETQKFQVDEGDVLAFPGSIKHSYRNTTAHNARFLSLVALAPLF